jgi:hypothetical protein
MKAFCQSPAKQIDASDRRKMQSNLWPVFTIAGFAKVRSADPSNMPKASETNKY